MAPLLLLAVGGYPLSSSARKPLPEVTVIKTRGVLANVVTTLNQDAVMQRLPGELCELVQSDRQWDTQLTKDRLATATRESRTMTYLIEKSLVIALPIPSMSRDQPRFTVTYVLSDEGREWYDNFYNQIEGNGQIITGLSISSTTQPHSPSAKQTHINSSLSGNSGVINLELPLRMETLSSKTISTDIIPVLTEQENQISTKSEILNEIECTYRGFIRGLHTHIEEHCGRVPQCTEENPRCSFCLWDNWMKKGTLICPLFHGDTPTWSDVQNQIIQIEIPQENSDYCTPFTITYRKVQWLKRRKEAGWDDKYE
jgi:hypothetical protein